MNKFKPRTIIILAVVIFSILTLGLVALFLKSTIYIKTTPTAETTKVDGVSYPSTTLKVSPGNHKVSVMVNGYNALDKIVYAPIFGSVTISDKLSKNAESVNKDEAKKVADNFINAFFTYTNELSNDYFSGIKPFMTQDFYNITYTASTSRPQDFVGEEPQQVKIIKSSFVNSSDSTTIKMEYEVMLKELTSKTLSNNIIKIELKKVNNLWLVNYFDILNEG